MVNENFRWEVSLLEGFSKISWIPTVRLKCRLDLKLFQAKAHSMVHTPCPGKLVFNTNSCSKVLGWCTIFFEKRSLLSSRSFFSALPGAKHPDGCFAPQGGATLLKDYTSRLHILLCLVNILTHAWHLLIDLCIAGQGFSGKPMFTRNGTGKGTL